MPFELLTEKSSKFRLLISGNPGSNKTTSLPTFIYGTDQWEDEDYSITLESLEFASNKKMVVITCPGETGTRSLVVTPHIQNYTFKYEGDMSDVKYSLESVKEFEQLTYSMQKDLPDILVIDGASSYFSHKMNVITEGAYLSGQRFVAFRYIDCCNAFGQYMSRLYNSSIPLIIVTTWEAWETEKDQDTAKLSIDEKAKLPKKIWPQFPGKMAKEVVGKFDARVSAQRVQTCLHQAYSKGPKDIRCLDAFHKEDHFVWQFLPKGDIDGVGIKGLRRVSKQMKEFPYIHQNYSKLLELIHACQ